MEFENDLIKLLTKLHEKRVNEKIENENFINVNINNHYDLQDTLENAERYVEMYINEKGKFNNTIQSLSKKIDNQVEEKRNNFNNLKQKLDFVIEKSNNVQKDLNNKKSESLTLKSSYESIKPEYENYNLKLIDLISSVEKQITSKSQNYTEIKSQLSNIIDINKKRYKLEEKILKIKEDDLKYNHEYKNYKLLEQESTLDNNFLSAINDNLITNQKEIKDIKQNLTSEINKLSKLTNQNENINKLELEKSHFSEQYKETRKKYKELIKEQEEMELIIQELMKKKNKLNSNINAKEIENNLRINKKKNDLNEIQKIIKNVENELLNDIVKHKDVSSHKISLY